MARAPQRPRISVACANCGAVRAVRPSTYERGWGRYCSVTCRAAAVTTKHGHGWPKQSPTYHSWRAMRVRCNNPAAPKYADYGGRGIKVCPEWDASFEAFLADMGVRPPGQSLDRIDNDGDYTPENCRWATRSQQNRNMRITPYLTYRGKRIAAADLAEMLGISTHGLKHRAKAGWPEEEWSKPSQRARR